MGHEVFAKGIRWVVNNGLSVSFWKDKWVGEKSIREIIQGPLTLEEENFMVGHVIEGATHWDLTKLSLVLPSSIVKCIRATHLCTLNSMGDQLAWDSSDGEFNLRKAYQLACKPDLLPTQDAQVKWLWQPFSSPRVLFFLWQCYHDSVPVKCTLAHRGITISTQCPRCSCPNESLIHTLRDCPDSTYFWNKLSPPLVCHPSFSSSFSDWLAFNCKHTSLHHSSHIKWQTVFAFGLWSLWLRRNQFIFNPNVPFPDAVANTIYLALEFFSLWGGGGKSKVSTPLQVKWLLPPSGWAKLNTDGSSFGNPGPAGGGGVIRDSLGTWIQGFSRSIGFATSVQTELRALLDGLLMAIELDIQYLEIEMDSLVAIDLILDNKSTNVFLSSMVHDCRSLMDKFVRFSLRHVYREANGCADLLAKSGCDQIVEFSFFQHPSCVCA